MLFLVNGLQASDTNTLKFTDNIFKQKKVKKSVDNWRATASFSDKKRIQREKKERKFVSVNIFFVYRVLRNFPLVFRISIFFNCWVSQSNMFSASDEKRIVLGSKENLDENMANFSLKVIKIEIVLYFPGTCLLSKNIVANILFFCCCGCCWARHHLIHICMWVYD